MNHRAVFVTIMAAWILWQEILPPGSHPPPSWHLEGGFPSETACHEARDIHLIEQMLRADNGGPTIVNTPNVQDGTLWLQWPNGERSRIRFSCFPDIIDPREPWS